MNHWAEIAQLFDRLGGDRPNYTWSILHAAGVARHLGIDAISVVELGVAGGNGLVAMEDAADRASEALGVAIEVHGFDTGAGLPAPQDHRDAPYIMAPGDFPMDEDKLRSRLRHATLHLGPVAETIGGFIDTLEAPIGFVAFDLDFYSSTADALELLDGPADRYLPRVLAYFDDILGYPWGDSNGPRPAIAEFNASHDRRIVDELRGLRHVTPPSQFHARWVEAMFLIHVLDHPRYAEYEGTALVTRLDLA